MTLRLIALLSLASLTSCVGQSGRAKYETPRYKTVIADGAFELRDYPSLVLASAPMNSKRAGQNSAFRSLFKYISGKNEKSQKIAMTTPVFATMAEEGNAMSFVVPENVVESGVPAADNSEIVISTRKAGRFAAYRYSGRWSRTLEEAGQKKLSEWIAKQGLKTSGGFEKASYDPPFTPPSKRRNEVLIRIQK